MVPFHPAYKFQDCSIAHRNYGRVGLSNRLRRHVRRDHPCCHGCFLRDNIHTCGVELIPSFDCRVSAVWLVVQTFVTVAPGMLRAAGSIWKGDLSTGEGKIMVEDAGGMATGLTYDKRSGYLYVCGGFTGEHGIYDDTLNVC